MKMFFALGITIVSLLFNIRIYSSSEYISLKELCHYEDPEVLVPKIPHAVQKKIYGILAPLFSKKPWKGKYPESPITNHDYPKLQALCCILSGFLSVKDIGEKVFEYIFCKSFRLDQMRQYKKFWSQVSFIPFLHNNEIWSLQDDYGELKRNVGYWSYFDHSQDSLVKYNSSDCLRLSVQNYFNYHTNPLAVVKIPKEKTVELNFGDNLIACLFQYGCMSIVDLSTMKEVWTRKYHSTRTGYNGTIKAVFEDQYGLLIAGYKDQFCFLNVLKMGFAVKPQLTFYTVSDLLNKRGPWRTIDYIDEGNWKFQLAVTGSPDHAMPRALNSAFLFYTFFKKKFVDYGPHSYFERSAIDPACTNLYYVTYNHESDTTEKVLCSLKDGSFFEYLSCNDRTLIACDEKGALYIWDLTQEPICLKQTVKPEQNMLREDFWLDPDSDFILTKTGTFKIQEAFALLPPINQRIVLHKLINTAQELLPKVEEQVPMAKQSRLKRFCAALDQLIKTLYLAIKKLLVKLFKNRR